MIVPSPFEARPAERLLAPDVARAATAAMTGTTATVEQPDSLRGPAASVLVAELVMGPLARLADAALALQNVVLRRCVIADERSDDPLRAAFLATVRAAASVIALGYGTDQNRTAVEELLTTFDAASDGRERVGALIVSLERVPAQLSALRGLEPALTGLPALEMVVLDGETDGERCALAVTIVANVREVALAMKQRWREGLVDAHWAGGADDLSSRRRLHDLISGILAAVDRLAGNLAAPLDGGRPSLPFLAAERNRTYLIEAFSGTQRQAAMLHRFAAPDSPADQAVSALERLIEEAAGELAGWSGDGVGATRAELASADLRSARRLIVSDLAEAFGFDPAAIARPLAAIGPDVVGSPLVPPTPATR
ncbi:hypothetical protein [Acuticoccus sp.]|uniref:hypothetical protein n=1 Tax=Acuticoccus sp. TaxID=1904378 RepID=UPI003B52E0E9